jgi:hypothetical protein
MPTRHRRPSIHWFRERSSHLDIPPPSPDAAPVTNTDNSASDSHANALNPRQGTGPVTFSRPRWPVIATLAAALALSAAATVILHHKTPPPAPASAPPPATNPTAVKIPTQNATIAQIDAHHGATPTLFRLQEDPNVLVLDFPVLHDQARMLNRVAALIEKADMPRNRVVTEAELDAHIRATGGDPDAYYYGHDYRAADLARFFLLAAQQKVPLNPQETWLRDTLDHDGWLKPDAIGALISIPGITGVIDAASRTTIFRHELSHAVYFTDPAYVALTKHFWNDMLTATERDAMRTFLGKDGYDTKDEDLMANEGQAYLIHTRDPRYFMPAMVGIDPTREAALRGAFVDAIPEPWLKASALAVAPIVPAGTDAPKISAEPSSAPEHPLPHVPLPGEGRPWIQPIH